MKRTLNLKFLAWLLGGLIVCGTGAHFLHGYQVKRNAGALLEQADRAENEGRPDVAVDYLGRYLAYVPGDDDAFVRYGLLLDKQAKSARAKFKAFLVLDQVLRRQPGREDVRRREALLSMELRRFSDAEEHLKKLRKNPPADAEVEELLGGCAAARSKYTARGREKGAREYFQSAIRIAPDRLSSYILLGRLLRHQTRDMKVLAESVEAVKALADQTVDKMVQANPKSFQAYLERALYRKEFGSAAEAEKDLAEARKLAPNEAAVLLVSAELARGRGDLAEARKHLRAGCQEHPTDPRMYLALAAVEVQAGKPEAAVSCLRQGLESLPKQTGLLWELANALLLAGQDGQAAETAERLRHENFAPVLLDYLNARLRMAKQEWLPAARLLERTYPLLTANPQATRQAGLFLARCYEKLGDADRAHAAYTRVVALDPQSALARLGSARVLTAMGQLPEALMQYRELLKLSLKKSDVPAAVLTEMARLLILTNLQTNQPDWEEVNKLLDEAEKTAPSAEVAVLQAEVLALQEKFDLARARLEKADGKAPRPAEVWVALAALEESQGRPEAALQQLHEAEQQLGDRVELRLARAAHWARQQARRATKGTSPKGAEARQELERLLAGAERFTAAEQQRLRRGLARAFAQAGATGAAARLWAQLAEQRRDDLRVRIAQFDLALEAGDGPLAERVIEDMRRIEGPEGTVSRYARAAHLVQRAQDGDLKGLDEAEGLLGSVSARRPNWSRVPLCQARIKELRKKPDAALSSYLRAIQLGDRSLFAVGRTIELLYQRRRYTEAYEIANRLPKHASLSGGLQKVVAEVSLEAAANDKGRALGLAQKAVARDSKDYREFLWLGRILWLSGQSDEAEAAFRRALKLDDKVPDTWVALIQYLALSKRKAEAEEQIKKAEGKLPRDKAALALAQCCEAVGRTEQAAKLYQTALASNAHDVPTLQALVGFALRSRKVDAARQHLTTLVGLKRKDPAAAAAARRALALLMTVGGDYQESRKALALMGLAEQGEPESVSATESVQERRTRAALLALQGDRGERRRAIPILEKLIQQRVARPSDEFLLAQVYESTGDWPSARKYLLKLLARPQGDKPDYVAYYALALLRHDEPAEAESWLGKLKGVKAAAGSFTLAEIEARLLKARGKGRAAVELLTTYAARKGANVGAVAVLLENLKEPEAAEPLYRRFVAAAKAEKPEAVLALAAFLGRRGRVSDALDLCEGAWKTCRPVAVTQTCLYILSGTPADATHCARVERWLKSAVEKDSKSSSLPAALAHVQNLQGRYDAAAAVYRKALRTNPRDAMALNNLAFLLALRGGDSPEPLALVQQACEVAGPRPGFLDTRAVIRLKKGDVPAAVRDLQTALAQAPSVSAYFHLAQAHALARDRTKAKVAWTKARTMGLEASSLHPLERRAYERLARQLD